MISVIIPTRNRADLLAQALESLTRQILTSSVFEVLVIDNGSTDHTAAAVKFFSAKWDNLRYFHEPEPGLHAGRHRGMLEARYNILVFADDDIEALPSWLAAIREAFSDPTVAMVGGNNLPLFIGPTPLWIKHMWERSTLNGGRALPSLSILELPGQCRAFNPFYVWGCNFSIRKDVLKAAGGFHPDGMPKELIRFRGDGETHVSKYVSNSGLKCLFHPGASVYHKVTPERMTFAYFRQRGFNQGISDSYTALRNEYKTAVHSQRLNIFSRAVRWGSRKFRAFVIIDQNVKRAQLELKAGHREGYDYHQQIYHEDANVREWVHKPKYFEETITAETEAIPTSVLK